MVESKRHRYRIGCEVLDKVAAAVAADARVRHFHAATDKAEGQWVERLVLTGANGSFELQVQPNGVIRLGQHPEWPVHPGDEDRTESAVRYLAELLIDEALGQPLKRGPLSSFGKG